MDHDDHAALIRDGVVGAGSRWLELGAGEGAFTLALADILAPDGEILATDRESRALRSLEARVRRAFPETRLETRAFDFTDAIPSGPFDGVLAANSLHFGSGPRPDAPSDPALAQAGRPAGHRRVRRRPRQSLGAIPVLVRDVAS